MLYYILRLLIFSFLGINLLDILTLLKLLIKLFGPIVSQLLSLIGYTTDFIKYIS